VSETIHTVEIAIRNPVADSRWFNILTGIREGLNFIKRYMSGSDVSLPEEDALRELLLNAYLHRCYRTQGPLQIRIQSDEIEIQNPGGLLGDLTPANLLYAPPNYRNFLLADSARQFGLCEKAGTGIDKVYHHLLLNGFDFPVIDAKSNSFSVVVRTKRDPAFARFVREFAGTLDIRFTDMIVMRALRQKERLNASQLASLSQRLLVYMEDVLSSLERKSVIVASPSAYRLSDSTLAQLERYDQCSQLRLL
jgi:predicted HTH transcriptional regulator